MAETVEASREEAASASNGSPNNLRVVRLMAFVLVPAIFIGFIALALFRTAKPGNLVGKTAPEFQLPLLGTGQLLSSEQLKGHPVVINFWASWCVPCREEARTLEQGWLKYKDEGVRILGVNVQDSEADAQAFVKEFGVTFPSVRDTDLKLWTKMGVRGLPETFFIDHSWTFVGIGSGRQVDNSGGTKILGAIDPALLDSQIKVLLERQRQDSKQ
ncbi:MAG: TlpA disulfide reductase family protein [Actinomycetota bacterium]